MACRAPAGEGLCGDFPCQTLHGFAYDPQQGDNGGRICQCEKWRG